MRVYESKYTKVSDAELSDAVAKNKTIRSVIAHLGVSFSGGSRVHFTRRIKELGLDTSHHVGQRFGLGVPGIAKKSTEEILVKRDSGDRQRTNALRRALFDIGRKEICARCGQLPEWFGSPMTLDVDHENGDKLDDRAENLRFLCPNCHSQFSRKLIES